MAHEPAFSSATIVNRFIDGLKDDIRAVVIIQRPHNLDSASSIALLQEETIRDVPRREFRKHEHNTSFKYSGRHGYQHHQKADPSSTTAKKNSELMKHSHSEDKAATLMNYRKAKGLCYKCGMKWSPGHKCASTVPLHTVEELWQVLCGEDEPEPIPPQSEESSDEDFMEISLDAAQGTDSCTTVRMIGELAGVEAVILIDSGSTNSFVSESLASRILDGESGLLYLCH